MMVGLFEPDAAAWRVEGIPRDSSFLTLPPDWDRMAPFLETAMDRVPITHEVGIRTFFCGPESFTPDLAPAVGEAPGISGYFVAAGMNSVGVLSAGGLGRVLAEWIVSGRPDVDVTGFDVARFRPDQLAPAYRATRTTEILGTVYAAHTPGKQLRTAREAILSPVHQRLAEQGGYLREVSGWEGADWFAGYGVVPHAEPTWGHAPWFEAWSQEHQAVREGVGLMDMSFMAKLSVNGPDAGALLDHVSAGAVDGDAGRHHLHAVAQRGWPHRGRPDGHQARREPLPRRGLRHRPRARARLAAEGGRAPRGRRHHHRRHARPRAAQPPGAAVARRAVRADRRPTCRPRSTRSAPPARSRSPASRSSARGSPTSASWATSSTCPPGRALEVYDALLACGCCRTASARSG